jgi:hypothetical protein
VNKDIPLWVAVVIGLGPSVVAVVAIVAAEFRDRRRLQHEREMQLNEARREAYANLSKLTKGMNIETPEAVPEVREAHALVEILGGNPKLLDVAGTLVGFNIITVTYPDLALFGDRCHACPRGRSEPCREPALTTSN